MSVTMVKKALHWFALSVLGVIAGGYLSWGVGIAGSALSAAGIGALHYSYEVLTVVSFFAAVAVTVGALRRRRRQVAWKTVLVVSMACGYIAFTIAITVFLALFAVDMSGFEP
ncbi:hypothetical protein PQI66_12490 [Corynebacterium sp. USCH3]|uniref:hypothetical protein n=1 Tax=Corynebacterium sp. USCH3 TaxID=3024840 RepID=UPI00309AD2FB